MFLWRVGGVALQVKRRVGCGTRHQLDIGHEETVFALGPDGVLDRPLPHHARRSFPVLLVRGELADLLDASSAHQNPARAFHKGHVLGIKQAQRIVWSQMPGKPLKQCRLVGRFMNPAGLVAQFGLPALVRIQLQRVSVVVEVLAHHPAERHDARRKGGVALLRRPEVAVVFLVHFGQRVTLDQLQLEGRHEGRPFVDATGPMLARQVFQAAAMKGDFLLVVLA